MKKFYLGLLSVMCLMCPSLALAGFIGVTPTTPTTTTTGSNDTTLFAGLNWTFGNQGSGVEGILGVAYGDIDVDGDVEGAKASLHFGFTDGLSVDKFKLTGLFGTDSAQAEIGGGFNFGSNTFFGVIGANGEFYHAGVDIGFDGTFEGYIGLHTIGELSLETVTTEGVGAELGDTFVDAAQ